jgi:hypothetical protein
MKRTPIQGEATFEEYATCGYEYLGTVEVEIPETGEYRTLELRFWGGPTDHVWNYSTPREFYRDLVEKNGWRVTGYGVQGIGPREDLLVESNQGATVTL